MYSRTNGNHAVAFSAIRTLHEPLITSVYVVDETLTLLRARGENQRAIAFGRRLNEGKSAKVVRVDEEDFTAAWDVFRRFHDKAWSFTDCTSRAIMERLGIKRAFAFDDDFRQFGTVAVLP